MIIQLSLVKRTENPSALIGRVMIVLDEVKSFAESIKKMQKSSMVEATKDIELAHLGTWPF